MEDTCNLPTVEVDIEGPLLEKRMNRVCLSPGVLLVPRGIPWRAPYTCLRVIGRSSRRIHVETMEVTTHVTVTGFRTVLEPIMDSDKQEQVLRGSIRIEEVYKYYREWKPLYA